MGRAVRLATMRGRATHQNLLVHIPQAFSLCNHFCWYGCYTPPTKHKKGRFKLSKIHRKGDLSVSL